ncbi:hypothetical protein WJX74_009849 [Apatococcus lobatus]|uniref:Uncharacterized protein n=1 Tax=Apatococcus lobatus TaxID=904363 RepID=A0AAW1RV65_9CHLO
MADDTANGTEETAPRRRRGRPRKAPMPADPPVEIVDSADAPEAQEDAAEEPGLQAEDPEWEPDVSAAAGAEASHAEGTQEGLAGSASDDEEKLSPTRKSSRRRRTKGFKAGSPAPDLNAEDQAHGGAAEQGGTAEEDLVISPSKKPKVAKPPPVPSGMTDVCSLQRSEGRTFSAPTNALGDALAAYNLLRAFSWQLRLSPCTFADFCAALGSGRPTPLMDEIHVCVLRTLAEDETRSSRAIRVLPLDQMDTVTWPEYVWEWLQLIGSPLAKLRWSQPASLGPMQQAPLNQPLAGDVPAAELPQGMQGGEPAAKQPHAEGPADPVDPVPAAAAADQQLPQQQPAIDSTQSNDEQQQQQPSRESTQPQAEAQPQHHAGNQEGQQSHDTMEDKANVEDKGRLQKLPWQLGQAGTECPTLHDMIQPRRPPSHKLQIEYSSLSMADKAAILAQLCDNLLDLRTIRNEIERRETEGHWVAGHGGEGGICPMRTLEERARRNNPETDENGNPVAPVSGDGNSDLCMLCNQGGSLLCCDGCPAAYHVRCIGETARSLPDGEWLCPECSLGGRGEASGLRIPIAGLDSEKAPHWAAHSALWWGPHGATANGLIGSEADDCLGDCLTCASGPDKAAAAKALRKPRADERPYKSTVESIADGPIIPGAHTATAEGFLNRYRNAWPAAVTATRSWVEDAVKRKGRPLPGTSTHIQLSELPIPLPISRFQWPLSAGKGSKGVEKCGKCRHCTIPSLRKACINPIKALPEGGPEPSDSSSKLPSLANYLIKAERELWGLLEGPWAGLEGNGFRRCWGQQVRAATSAGQLAAAAEALEMALRRIALSSSWDAAQKPLGHGALNPGLGHKWASTVAQAERKALGKQVSGAGLASEPTRKGVGRPRKSSMAGSSVAPASGPIKKRRKQQESDSEPDDLSEPESDASYDWREDGGLLDNKSQKTFADWIMDNRSRQHKLKSGPRLPQHALRKAARRGSKKRIPGVMYNIDRPALVPSLVWRGVVEDAVTSARLGLALRTLDTQISWEGLKRPAADSGAPFASLEISAKQLAASGQGSEYLIHQPEEVPTQPPPSSSQPHKQGPSLSAFSCPLMPRNPSSQAPSHLSTPLLPAALRGGLQPHLQAAGGRSAHAASVGDLPGHPAEVVPKPADVPDTSTADPAEAPMAVADPHGIAAHAAPSVIASMGAAPAVADVQAAPMGPTLDAATALREAHGGLDPAVTGAKGAGPVDGTCKGPAVVSMQPGLSEAGTSIKPLKKPEAPADHPIAHAPAPDAPFDAHPMGRAPSGAEPPSDGPAQHVTTANGHNAHMTGNSEPTQAKGSPSANGCDPELTASPVEQVPQALPSPGIAGLQNGAAVANGDAQDKGPASKLPEPTAMHNSRQAQDVLAANSNLKSIANGSATSNTEGRPMDASPAVAADHENLSVPPEPSVSLREGSLVLPGDARTDALTAPPEADMVADPSLAVIGTATGIPKPATEAVVAEALPEEIVMADGFLGNGPPSPPAPSSSADAGPGPAAAEPTQLDSSPKSIECHEQGPSRLDGLPYHAQPETSEKTLDQPTAEGTNDLRTSSSLIDQPQPSPIAAAAVDELKNEAAVASSAMKQDTTTAQVPNNDQSTLLAPEANKSETSTENVSQPGTCSDAAVFAAADKPAASVNNPQGEGHMRAGPTAKGGAPSLMGLLRTIGPPRVNSPVVGTPLSSLSTLVPQGASHAQPQHPLAGKWVHENELPLWLIKAFEEKSRREAAVEAARAAREAAREAARGAAQSERQAAHQAAAAAAATAGDACAVCGLVSGDVPEKDHFWIACDNCNKWYHGDCIGMNEEQNKDLADDEKWECPECATARIDRRIAATERARQRRLTQGRTTGIRLTPEQHEKAKTKGVEDLQRKQRKKEKQARAADASEGDATAVPGSKPKRPRKPKDKGKENEGDGKLYCICKQPDDHTHPFIQCDDCGGWYHPDCVGATLAEAANQEQWTCPDCIGKLKRRKTKFTAASNSPQLHMAARRQVDSREGPLEDDQSNGRRRKRKSFPGDEFVEDVLPAKPSGKGLKGGAKKSADGWRTHVLHVLDAAMTYPPAVPFTSPVSEEQAPGYHEVVKRPMDLGTLRDRVAAGHYSNALAVLSDIRLIWKNCRSFNAEGSDIAIACTDAAKWVRRKWSQQGLPKKEKPAQPGTQGSASPLGPGPSSQTSNRAERAAAGDEAAEPSGTLAEDAMREAAFGIRKRKRRPLEECRDEHAGGDRHRRKGRGALTGDSKWVSMKGYGGEPDAPAPNGKANWPKLKVKLKGMGPGSATEPHAQAGPGTVRAEPVNVARQLRSAHKVIKQVLKLKCSATFAVPVTDEAVPNYSNVIKEPRDLGSISEKLKASGEDVYASLGELLADVRLVWKNCRTFNAVGSEINQLCDETEAAFNQHWQQAGLPMSKAGKPRAEPARKKQGPDAAASARPTRRSGAAQPEGEPSAEDSKQVDEEPQHAGKTKAGRQTGRFFRDGAGAAGPSKFLGSEGQGPSKGHVKAPKRMRSLNELPSESGPVELQKKTKKRKAQGDDDGPDLDGPLGNALGVVKGMLKVKAALPFIRPVLESQVPGYHKVVKKPMDLSTVRDGIQEGQYSDAGAIWADLQQVWRNCRAFNTKGSLVGNLGEQAAATLQDRWTAAGLPVPSGAQKGRSTAPSLEASPPSKPLKKVRLGKGSALEVVSDRPTRRGRSDPNQQLESLETAAPALQKAPKDASAAPTEQQGRRKNQQPRRSSGDDAATRASGEGAVKRTRGQPQQEAADGHEDDAAVPENDTGAAQGLTLKADSRRGRRRDPSVAFVNPHSPSRGRVLPAQGAPPREQPGPAEGSPKITRAGKRKRDEGPAADETGQPAAVEAAAPRRARPQAPAIAPEVGSKRTSPRSGDPAHEPSSKTAGVSRVRKPGQGKPLRVPRRSGRSQANEDKAAPATNLSNGKLGADAEVPMKGRKDKGGQPRTTRSRVAPSQSEPESRQQPPVRRSGSKNQPAVAAPGPGRPAAAAEASRGAAGTRRSPSPSGRATRGYKEASPALPRPRRSSRGTTAEGLQDLPASIDDSQPQPPADGHVQADEDPKASGSGSLKQARPAKRQKRGRSGEKEVQDKAPAADGVPSAPAAEISKGTGKGRQRKTAAAPDDAEETGLGGEAIAAEADAGPSRRRSRSSSRAPEKEPAASQSPIQAQRKKGKDPDMPDLSAFIEYRRSSRHAPAEHQAPAAMRRMKNRR